MSRFLRAFLGLALTATCAAAADSTKHFAGKTSQNLPVKFRVEGSTIVGLTVTASVYCISLQQSSFELYPIVAEAPLTLSNSGEFTLRRNKEGKDRAKLTLTGRVSGSTAKGQLEIAYPKSIPRFNPFTHLLEYIIASCTAKGTWTAQLGGTGENAEPRTPEAVPQQQ